eukprot:g2719.t1
MLETPPKHLIVIDHRKNNTRNIHHLFSTKNSIEETFPREYEAYLILNFSVVHGFTHTYFNEEDLRDCYIRFLPIDEQPKFSKLEMFVDINDNTKVGNKTQRKLIVGSSNIFGSYGDDDKQDKRCQSSNNVLNTNLKLNLHRMYILANLQNATKNGQLTSLAELSESDMLHLQTQWMETGTFMDAITEIIDPILALIWEALMGNWLLHEATQTVGMVMEEVPDPIAENVHTTMQHLLAPMIGGMLPEKVMSAVHEQLPDSLIEAVTAALNEIVPGMITENLAPVLVTSLTKSLSQSIGVSATKEMGEHLSRKSANTLTTILGKSLTHSIVPTLLHTMSHNPLQDYYCYYCHTHKTYCQYCNYAPSQLYYAMYYAGFYSTYYTNYYPEAFAAAEEQASSVGSY